MRNEEKKIGSACTQIPSPPYVWELNWMKWDRKKTLSNPESKLDKLDLKRMLRLLAVIVWNTRWQS